MKMPLASLSFALCLGWVSGARAEAAAPHALAASGLFADNMVLQQGVVVPLWGFANDGEKVTVEFAGQSVSATAKEGKWLARLQPLKAGGPFTLVIRGSKTITFTNLLVGEVWLCSGQSNMEWALGRSTGGPEAVTNSANAQLRLCTIPHNSQMTPQDNVKAKWAAELVYRQKCQVAAIWNTMSQFRSYCARAGLAVLILLAGNSCAEAGLRLSGIFSDHMMCPDATKHPRDAKWPFPIKGCRRKNFSDAMIMIAPSFEFALSNKLAHSCSLLAAIALLSGSAPLQAADSPREKLLLDLNWRFSNGDPADAGKLFDYPESDLSKQYPKSEAVENELAKKRPDPVKTNLGGGVSWVQSGFDDSGWRTVNLPHDWAVGLPFDSKGNVNSGYKAIGPKFPRNSIGWYRRSFELPDADKGRTVWFELGGAFRNTLVWLNGHCLGRMASGYTPFYYDLTPHLNFGGTNTLVVRADATGDENWGCNFYEGGGIYRHAWMIKTLPVHVAHWGTYVTSKVAGEKAEVAIQTTVENTASQPAQAELVSIIQDAAGAEIAGTKSPVEIPAGGRTVLNQSIPVPDPKLWSPETPNMYALVTRIEGQGGLSDLYRTPFGIRTVEFRPDGFYLNGKHRFIKGACNHEDFAGIGLAVPDRVNAYRVGMLKEMGCDGWRTCHPVSEELLDECDRQGMFVQGETRRFGQYAEPLSNLEAMILRDRNHPSIVLWCMGNEEWQIQATPYGAQACQTMQDLAHRLDPSRVCTVAMNHEDDNAGFATVIDVVGMNYMRLWGGMSRAHEKYPERRFLGTEEASLLTTRGQYFIDEQRCYLTGYDTYTPGWGTSAEGWWNHYSERPWIAGAFIWTGFDYRGEPTPYAWPCINAHYGSMDTCGFPKDNYYYYQAWWTTTTVLHLYPHWNWNQVGHRLVKVSLKTTFPRAEVACGRITTGTNGIVEWYIEHEKKTGNGPAEWSFYDAGNATNISVVLRRVTLQTDASGKEREVKADVVKQTIPIPDQQRTITLQALPGQPELPAGENEITISRVIAPINIWVQSNCEEVELVVNGASQGRKKVEPRHHLEWTVPYAPGAISATGYKAGRAVKTETIETTGPAAALRLSANRTSLNGDGEDAVLVKVEALDAQNRFVPTAGNLLHFEVTGNGRLLGVGNGDPSCLESDLGPERSLFNGLALGIVQASRSGGSVTVKVSSGGLKPAELALPVKPCAARPAVP